MKTEKTDHVAIFVEDMDKAMKFFGDLFETSFLEPWPMEPLDIRETMDPLGISLVAPLTPDGEAARSLRRRGEGLNGLVIKVSNLEEAVAEMKSRGIREIWRVEFTKGDQGWKSVAFHPKDTFGVMIELTEYDTETHPLMTGRRDDVVRTEVKYPPSV